MNAWTAIAIVVVALVAIAAIVWTYRGRRRSGELRDRFGPEYERMVHEHGGRRSAEAELERREKRVRRLAIRPLPVDLRNRFEELWRHDQERFVEDPANAVDEAQHLVEEAMRARGYPVGNFEQRAADISVDHPHVVENYRAAQEIAVRNEEGRAETEDLRKAMMHYRALFDELLSDTVTQTARPMEAHAR